jgi:hypothetical protein
MGLKENRMRSSALDSSGSEQGSVAGSCDDNNEILGPLICWEFLENVTIKPLSSMKLF